VINGLTALAIPFHHLAWRFFQITGTAEADTRRYRQAWAILSVPRAHRSPAGCVCKPLRLDEIKSGCDWRKIF
jgi:hypothetical protein